jgi:hypothetical protein
MSTPSPKEPTQISQELRDVLEAFEFKNDGKPKDADITDIWVSGVPIGKLIEGASERSKENESRIQDIESGEIDPDQAIGNVDTDLLPPIHQMYLSVKAGHGDAMSDNQRRAAKVWPYFSKYADTNFGNKALTSTKIRDIFERELDDEEDNPYSKTVKRVMDQLVKFSDGLLEVDETSNPNRIVASQEDWEDLMGRVDEAMNGGDPDDSINPESGSDEGSSTVDQADAGIVSAHQVEEVGSR